MLSARRFFPALAVRPSASPVGPATAPSMQRLAHQLGRLLQAFLDLLEPLSSVTHIRGGRESLWPHGPSARGQAPTLNRNHTLLHTHTPTPHTSQIDLNFVCFFSNVSLSTLVDVSATGRSRGGDTTDIPWCAFQGSGSNLFQEMQLVMRIPPSQTMMLPI